jgi:hypothetical protein
LDLEVLDVPNWKNFEAVEPIDDLELFENLEAQLFLLEKLSFCDRESPIEDAHVDTSMMSSVHEESSLHLVSGDSVKASLGCVNEGSELCRFSGDPSKQRTSMKVCLITHLS